MKKKEEEVKEELKKKEDEVKRKQEEVLDLWKKREKDWAKVESSYVQQLKNTNTELLRLKGKYSFIQTDSLTPICLYSVILSRTYLSLCLSSVYISVFEGTLGLRYVLEQLEFMLSSEKIMDPKLSRGRTWGGIFLNRPPLLEKLAGCYGLSCDRDDFSSQHFNKVKDIMVEKMVAMYRKLSKDIHHPQTDTTLKVPIRLYTLDITEVCMAIHLCELYPVAYDVYDVNNNELSGDEMDRLTTRGKVERVLDVE